MAFNCKICNSVMFKNYEKCYDCVEKCKCGNIITDRKKYDKCFECNMIQQGFKKINCKKCYVKSLIKPPGVYCYKCYVPKKKNSDENPT